jgi:hypothetical protein
MLLLLSDYELNSPKQTRRQMYLLEKNCLAGTRNAFELLTYGLVDSNLKDTSEITTCNDHKPERFHSIPCLRHEHSPPKARLIVNWHIFTADPTGP